MKKLQLLTIAGGSLLLCSCASMPDFTDRNMTQHDIAFKGLSDRDNTDFVIAYRFTYWWDDGSGAKSHIAAQPMELPWPNRPHKVKKQEAKKVEKPAATTTTTKKDDCKNKGDGNNGGGNGSDNNHSGLGDGTNPGNGSGNNNSGNGGTDNPNNSGGGGSTGGGSSGGGSGGGNDGGGGGNDNGNRSGLSDGTNPGEGELHHDNGGTLNPNNSGN
jgi:hypothetical protein